jgi:hypothetical protein
MTVLLLLLAAAIGVGLLLGVLAKMPPLQILAQCAAMSFAAIVFFGLVSLL